MDKQNFESKDRFPLSTQSLSFMQDMIKASAQLALIGGDNYILSGCVTTNNNVSDGIIVIDGEIMPFEGGAIVETITIIEETIPVSANGLTFENARIKRHAKFATGTGVNYYPWANFKHLQTNKQLEEAKATIKYVDDAIAGIQAGSIPTGVIVMWSGSVFDIPKGWQLCDDTPISGTDKRTPDLRGRFIVGYNKDDNDYESLSLKGGNKRISLREENTPPHRHLSGICDNGNEMFLEYGSLEKKSGNSALKGEGGTCYFQGYTSVDGNAAPFDVRPPYFVLAFIIKIDVK